MLFEGLISSDRIVLGFRATDKAHALGEAARRLASRAGIDPEFLLQTIMAREQLGSTGLGHGSALPHARLPGLETASGLLMRLARPIDFDAIDKQPVDIVFLLVMPADKPGEQMTALAAVARGMRNEHVLAAIRKAKNAAGLYEHLASTQA